MSMMKFSLLLFLTVYSCATAAMAEPLSFSDVDGGKHAVLAEDKKPVVLVFVSPYCPTSNAFTPEINRIAADYDGRVDFYLVEADAAITAADAKKHVGTMEIKAPVLLDPAQRLAKLTKAKTTPEAVVLAANGDTLYQGRINDLYATQTKKLKEPKTHDLRAALDAILSGKPVANPATKAIGCSISGTQ